MVSAFVLTWRGGPMASTGRGELLGQRAHSREANSDGGAGLGEAPPLRRRSRQDFEVVLE